MVPINWIAVIAAALAGAGVWQGLSGKRGGWARWLGAALLMLVSAAMLGHALARIGPEVLVVKPKLYFMQSGGLALAFVLPALLLSGARHGIAWKEGLRDGAVLLAAYLAMGAVFLVLA
jgi:hypothetical protein